MSHDTRTPSHGMVDHGQVSRTWLLRAIQRRDLFVYALLTKHGAVKFGVTIDLWGRQASQIDFGGTKHLLAYKPGYRMDEQAIHAAIPDEYRILGTREYYYPVRELLEWINPMREWMGVKPLHRKALPRLADCTFHARVMDLETTARRKSA